MGMFWDLFQDSEIYDQEERAYSLETRVARLEGDLLRTRRLLRTLLERLEREFGEDLNRDGRVA